MAGQERYLLYELAVETGTDDKLVEATQNDLNQLTPKLTPFWIPTAFSGCNDSATVGTQQSDIKANSNDYNCLDNGKLDNKKSCLSLAVIGKKQMRPTGIEPVTFGFEVRTPYFFNPCQIKNLHYF